MDSRMFRSAQFRPLLKALELIDRGGHYVSRQIGIDRQAVTRVGRDHESSWSSSDGATGPQAYH